MKFQLYGHPSLIKILHWNDTDSMLLSVCNNGSVYGWQTNFEIYSRESKPKKKTYGFGSDDSQQHAGKLEIIIKNSRVNAVGYDQEFDLLYLSTSDNKLLVFSTDNGKGCKNYV
jgi:hypothetical protein